MRKLFLSLALVFSLGQTASAEDSVTIYTYEGFVSDWGAGPPIAAAFEKQCACKVNFVGVQDGVALLTRLKLEGSQSKADVILGIDQNLVAEAEATGLFEESGVAFENSALPIEWTDRTFLPYDWSHFAVMYDREKVKQPPTSLKALVEEPLDTKIVLQDPRTSTPGLGFLLWMRSVYGDQAKEAWAKLKPKVLTVTPGWSESYGMFTKGEADMVISYTTSPAYHMIEDKTERYQAALFAEGHYLQVEVAGMLKAAPNKELARKFLAFMVSPGFQDLIATKNWMFPATKTSEPLPEAFDKLVKPSHTFMISPQEVADNRKAWIDEWLDVMSR